MSETRFRWDEKGDAAETVGRTIAAVDRDEDGSNEMLTLTFTDGTFLTIRSWDYEGYNSGLYVSVEEPLAEKRSSHLTPPVDSANLPPPTQG